MNKKHLYLRRVVFAFLIVCVASLQFSFAGAISIGNASPMLLLPLVVAIGVHENMITSVILGAFAGVLADSFSVTAFGFFAVSFALAAFVSSALTTFVFRRVFVVSALFCCLWAPAVNIFYWLLFVAIKHYDSVFVLLFEKYLPSAVYSAMFIIITYPLVRFVCKIGSGGENNED